MKKLLLGLVTAALTIGCTADNRLIVKGNMANVGDTLIAVNMETGQQTDTVAVKDGRFQMKIDVDSVALYFLVNPSVISGEGGARMNFVAVPGETLELTGDAEDRYDYGGSKFYQGYHEVDLMLEEAQKEEQTFTADLVRQMEMGAPQDSIMQVYQAAVEPMRQKKEEAIMNFIKTHPDLEASATLVPMVSPERMREAASLLGDKVRNGRMKAYYQRGIDQMEARAKEEEAAAAKQAAGADAPDFQLDDINGRPLKLSSLRGRYVVLDFWGSWCGWCIKGIPSMKEYYAKYAGKFEILGVDCNDTKEKWKEAVKRYELPWLHVYNPKGSSVLEDYGIQGFPTKIIIDPNGKIVKTIVGEDPAFYTLLDEMFK